MAVREHARPGLPARFPLQYQWHYKRYSKRPPGERNPYKPAP